MSPGVPGSHARRSAWQREPLLVFALIGGLLFAVDAATGRGAQEAPLVVDAPTRASIERRLGAELGRAPSPQELRAALSSHVDRELLIAEARRLGLDRGDPIVRRRLVQLMELVHESLHVDSLPDDEALLAWVAAHPDRYGAEARLDLAHRYFARDRHADPLGAARAALEAHGGPEQRTLPGTLGDPFPHGHELRGKERAALDAIFGPGRGEAIFALPLREWATIESSYGVHLVRVEEEIRAAPRFEAIRNRALADLLAARREAARARELEALRRRHGADRGGR